MSDQLVSDQQDVVADPGTIARSVRDDAGKVVWIRREFDDRQWRRSAACRDAEPAAFFPVGVTGPAVHQIAAAKAVGAHEFIIADAKAVCRGCPVRLACLQFALTTNQEFGIWGGHDEEERRDLRRRWARLGRPRRFVPVDPLDRGEAVPGSEESDGNPEAS